MKRLTLEIPDEPVAKARARVTFKNGRAHAYTPSRTVQAEQRIQLWAQSAMKRERFPMLTGPLSLMITVALRPPKSLRKRDWGKARPSVRPDWDNYAKLVADALGRAGAWKDDAQVVECYTRKEYAWETQPCWRIIIEELESA